LITSRERVAVRLSCCVHARAQALAWSGASALTTSDFLKLAATPSTRFFSLVEGAVHTHRKVLPGRTSIYTIAALQPSICDAMEPCSNRTPRLGRAIME
jgi:hypothetical protein